MSIDFKKDTSLLWYAGYLFFTIADFLRASGVVSQMGLSYTIIVKYNLDQQLVMIAATCFVWFFYSYYKYTKDIFFCKKIFKYLGRSGPFIYTLCAVDHFLNLNLNTEICLQYYLILISLVTLLIHLYLFYKQIIPVYLAVAFIIPVVCMVVFLLNPRSVFLSCFSEYFPENLVYDSILLNIVVLVLYVVKQSVEGELLALYLQKENSGLKIRFRKELNDSVDY